MPMNWTPENDRLLLLKLIETHDIKINYEKIREAWPKDAEHTPSTKALSERFLKIKKMSGVSTPRRGGSSVVPATPRLNKAVLSTTPKSTVQKRKPKTPKFDSDSDDGDAHMTDDEDFSPSKSRKMAAASGPKSAARKGGFVGKAGDDDDFQSYTPKSSGYFKIKRERLDDPFRDDFAISSAKQSPLKTDPKDNPFNSELAQLYQEALEVHNLSVSFTAAEQQVHAEQTALYMNDTISDSYAPEDEMMADAILAPSPWSPNDRVKQFLGMDFHDGAGDNEHGAEQMQMPADSQQYLSEYGNGINTGTPPMNLQSRAMRPGESNQDPLDSEWDALFNLPADGPDETALTATAPVAVTPRTHLANAMSDRLHMASPEDRRYVFPKSLAHLNSRDHNRIANGAPPPDFPVAPSPRRDRPVRQASVRATQGLSAFLEAEKEEGREMGERSSVEDSAGSEFGDDNYV